MMNPPPANMSGRAEAGEIIALAGIEEIRIGDTIITVEGVAKGPETVLLELKDAMAQGKGYHTILHEIIDEKKRP